MKKDFQLNKSIELPKRIVHRRLGGKNLLIAPEKPNWLVLDDVELTFARALINDQTVGEAINHLKQYKSLTDQNSESIAKKVLGDIEGYHFYENYEPIDLDKNAPPTRLHIYVTNRCNLLCVHCYKNALNQSDNPKAFENELRSEEWKRVIYDFNKEVGPTLVSFSGGEPLSRKDLFEIARFSKDLGNENFLFTNGTLINERNIDYLVKNIDKIQVSIDGTTEEAHDKVRGKGSFKRALRGLKLLKNSGISIMISYCIVSDNIKDIKDNIVNFIDSLQIKDIQLGVSIARKIGRWKENCRGCRDYSLGEAYKILENTLLQIYEKGWDSPAFYRNFIKRNCTFGQRFAVDSNGDVFPCAETVYKIGNVRNESIRDISARLKEVHQLSDVEHTETCRLCDIKYICRGGCKTLRAQNYNTPFRQECSSETRDLIYQKMADETII